MGVKRFVWDEVSDNVLLETDETDTVTARYCQRPERFGELLFQDRSGTKSFYHYDGNASTCNLTNSNESVTDTTLYTAYGEEVSVSGTTTNPFGYKGAVGYYTSESTGDIYVRNRSYEPTAGRWLSMDPLGFTDGSSLYRAYFVPGAVDAGGQFIGRLLDTDDATGTKCKIAIRCGKTGLRSGIYWGTHCGIMVDWGGNIYGVDGSGGPTNVIEWEQNPGNWEGSVTGPYRSYPNSVCLCLLQHTSNWNAQKIPRNDTCNNSNWTLKCMMKSCGIKITWGTGVSAKPPGYDCYWKKTGNCLRWVTRIRHDGMAREICPHCEEWEVIECPQVSTITSPPKPNERIKTR